MKLLVLFILSTFMSPTLCNGSLNCLTRSDKKNPIKKDGTFVIECHLTPEGGSDKIDSCRWEHWYPLNYGNATTADVECSFANPSSTKQCYTNTRITGSVNSTHCNIEGSNSIPEDTGTWKTTVSTINSGQKQRIETSVWSFNESSVVTLDNSMSNRTPTNQINTTYNWNDKEDHWEEGKDGWESIELICYAAGGRPVPTFGWEINGTKLKEDDDVFDIEEGDVYRSYGRNGEIEDYETSLSFYIDTKFLNTLDIDFDINTNPENGHFSLDITCVVDQAGYVDEKPKTVTMEVLKSYNDGIGVLSASSGPLISICVVLWMVMMS